MQLKHIKLAGFKSFVDPTRISFPTNMVAVVGPNGCGKSNVIDAVRWVLGELSAKNLRGESMSDVIFNGSDLRKPSGQCSIELLFDNSMGKLGGEYAKYNEISIKRMMTRDGQSHYSMNNTRCRRKDVQDIFLGTGLGPRSYAIIEQGMVSKIVSAKPEEMRVFIEEAAGISKYKERRKETEQRIKKTKENLSRVKDIRDEIQRLINRLQNQAKAAEKYKKLQVEEKELKLKEETQNRKDIDLKVSGENNANLIRTDAANDSVYFGVNGATGVDNNFFVSGSIGSATTSIRGTAVFGGDVVISGSLNPTTLKIAGTEVTSTPAELNLLDASVTSEASDGVWAVVERVAKITVDNNDYARSAGPASLGVTIPDNAILTKYVFDCTQTFAAGDDGSEVMAVVDLGLYNASGKVIDFTSQANIERTGASAAPYVAGASQVFPLAAASTKLTEALTAKIHVFDDGSGMLNSLDAGALDIYVYYIVGA